MQEKRNLSKLDQIKEKEEKTMIGQEQVQNLLFSKEIGWQEIIYDLINTEQLDPWGIDISILTDKYLKRVQELEQADFLLSGKILHAASLLIRIKSEILLNKYIQSIDDILFGKKPDKKYVLKRIELDEDIPELSLRSPLPRFKKVTLKELIESLNRAIKTENRRIDRVLIDKNAIRESSLSLPKRKFSIADKIKQIYENLIAHFKKDEKRIKISYSNFIGKEKEEKIRSFYPLLQLETQKKLWLEQESHFEEIYIWLKETFLKHNPDPLNEILKKLEAESQINSERKIKIKKFIAN